MGYCEALRGCTCEKEGYQRNDSLAENLPIAGQAYQPQTEVTRCLPPALPMSKCCSSTLNIENKTERDRERICCQVIKKQRKNDKNGRVRVAQRHRNIN